MGTHCCPQELDNYQIKVQKIQIIEKRKRNGLPSFKIGIKMSDLNDHAKEVNLKKIKKMVFKVAEYEKKFKRPYRINQEHIPQNKLSQPYYIPSLNMFYVGQWVYDEQVYDNVPWGIGRLYENNAISQGCFKTIFLNSEQIDAMRQLERTDVQYNLMAVKSEQNFHGSEINLTPKKELKLKGFSKSPTKIKDVKDQNYSRLQRKLKAVQGKEANQQEFIIKLHGQGRICEKYQEEQEEIEMEGDFYEGLLNGKGMLKITAKGIRSYYYSGQWKNGQRHGKGVQKLANYKYQGSFYQNSKQGKGIQTFISSVKDECSIDKDIKRMQLKLRNEEESMRIQILKKIAIRQYRQKMIKQELDKKVYPGSHIQFIIEKSLLLDSNFMMERTFRRNFAESYSGDFQNGKMQGSGIYIWPSGKTYKGKWKQSKLNGLGEFYWPEGYYFQGTYVNDQRYGEGTMVWSVNKRYRGSWAFGFRHGYGQSIQIDEKKAKMTIKGSIWNKDTVKKRIFKKTVELPYFNQTNQIQNLIEDQISGTKDKRKKNEYGDSMKLKSLKDIKQNHLVKQFDEELGKSDVK